MKVKSCLTENLLAEGFDIGHVYHQQFSNGERAYFKASTKQLNGRYSGLLLKPGSTKPVQGSADSTLHWKPTPHEEIPAGLK